MILLNHAFKIKELLLDCQHQTGQLAQKSEDTGTLRLKYFRQFLPGHTTRSSFPQTLPCITPCLTDPDHLNAFSPHHPILSSFIRPCPTIARGRELPLPEPGATGHHNDLELGRVLLMKLQSGPVPPAIQGQSCGTAIAHRLHKDTNAIFRLLVKFSTNLKSRDNGSFEPLEISS